jgi:hypothetical protein
MMKLLPTAATTTTARIGVAPSIRKHTHVRTVSRATNKSVTGKGVKALEDGLI